MSKSGVIAGFLKKKPKKAAAADAPSSGSAAPSAAHQHIGLGAAAGSSASDAWVEEEDVAPSTAEVISHALTSRVHELTEEDMAELGMIDGAGGSGGGGGDLEAAEAAKTWKLSRKLAAQKATLKASAEAAKEAPAASAASASLAMGWRARQAAGRVTGGGKVDISNAHMFPTLGGGPAPGTAPAKAPGSSNPWSKFAMADEEEEEEEAAPPAAAAAPAAALHATGAASTGVAASGAGAAASTTDYASVTLATLAIVGTEKVLSTRAEVVQRVRSVTEELKSTLNAGEALLRLTEIRTTPDAGLRRYAAYELLYQASEASKPEERAVFASVLKQAILPARAFTLDMLRGAASDLFSEESYPDIKEDNPKADAHLADVLKGAGLVAAGVIAASALPASLAKAMGVTATAAAPAAAAAAAAAPAAAEADVDAEGGKKKKKKKAMTFGDDDE